MFVWPYFYYAHPFGQALSLIVIALVLMTLFRAHAGMIGVSLVTLYAIASPIYNVAIAGPGLSWWWLTFLSLGSFIVLLLVVALIAGKLTPKGKDSGGGTAFGLPVIAWPPVLFITALVRLPIWLIRG